MSTRFEIEFDLHLVSSSFRLSAAVIYPRVAACLLVALTSCLCVQHTASLAPTVCVACKHVDTVAAPTDQD